MRGLVIAKTFELEYCVDQIITELLHPGPVSTVSKGESTTGTEESTSPRAVFHDVFLKSNRLSFYKKISILKELLELLGPLEQADSKSIINGLNRARGLRNNFAHYPVSLEIIGDIPDQDLEAVLVSRKATYRLDESFVAECNGILGRSYSDLQSLLKKLLGDAND